MKNCNKKKKKSGIVKLRNLGILLGVGVYILWRLGILSGRDDEGKEEFGGFDDYY